MVFGIINLDLQDSRNLEHISKEMTKREVVYNIHMALTGAFCQQ